MLEIVERKAEVGSEQLELDFGESYVEVQDALASSNRRVIQKALAIYDLNVDQMNQVMRLIYGFVEVNRGRRIDDLNPDQQDEIDELIAQFRERNAGDIGK